MTGIAPRTCSCGSAMEWRTSGHWDAKRGESRGVYLCAHCDRPCAGVVKVGACTRCDAMRVKR